MTTMTMMIIISRTPTTPPTTPAMSADPDDVETTQVYTSSYQFTTGLNNANAVKLGRHTADSNV